MNTHAKAIAIGCLLALIAINATQWWTSHQRESVPATAFFEVHNINIPDHVEGTDTPIIYDRDIKAEFPGSWIIEVHHATPESDTVVCNGSGSRIYQPGAKLPEGGPTLSWFLGPQGWLDCQKKMPPGQYYLAPNWEIRAPGYPVKQYSATSNIFTVLPKDAAQTYITKDQIEQLEKAQELLNNPAPLEGGTPQ